MSVTPQKVDATILQSPEFKAVCAEIDKRLLAGEQVMSRDDIEGGIPDGMLHLISAEYENAGWVVYAKLYENKLVFRRISD